MAWDFEPECCGWPVAETPKISHFLGQSRLYSLFGLRVGAGGGLYKSTGYARWFVVNLGHQLRLASKNACIEGALPVKSGVPHGTHFVTIISLSLD